MSSTRKHTEPLHILSLYEEWAKSFLQNRNSVKCTQDAEDSKFFKFASHLLADLAIEHPLGEYIVQVVDGFRKQYGSSQADTFLYFICRFTRAVSHLTIQGIPQDNAVCQMRTSLQCCINHVQHHTQSLEHTIETLMTRETIYPSVDITVTGVKPDGELSPSRHEKCEFGNSVKQVPLNTERTKLILTDYRECGGNKKTTLKSSNKKKNTDATIQESDVTEHVNWETYSQSWNRIVTRQADKGHSADGINVERPVNCFKNTIELSGSQISEMLDKTSEREMTEVEVKTPNAITDDNSIEPVLLKMDNLETEDIDDDLSWFFDGNDTKSVNNDEANLLKTSKYTEKQKEVHLASTEIDKNVESNGSKKESYQNGGEIVEVDSDSGCIEGQEDIVHELEQLQRDIQNDIENIKINKASAKGKDIVKVAHRSKEELKWSDSDSDFDECFDVLDIDRDFDDTQAVALQNQVYACNEDLEDEFQEVELTLHKAREVNKRVELGNKDIEKVDTDCELQQDKTSETKNPHDNHQTHLEKVIVTDFHEKSFADSRYPLKIYNNKVSVKFDEKHDSSELAGSSDACAANKNGCTMHYKTLDDNKDGIKGTKERSVSCQEKLSTNRTSVENIISTGNKEQMNVQTENVSVKGLNDLLKHVASKKSLNLKPSDSRMYSRHFPSTGQFSTNLERSVGASDELQDKDTKENDSIVIEGEQKEDSMDQNATETELLVNDLHKNGKLQEIDEFDFEDENETNEREGDLSGMSHVTKHNTYSGDDKLDAKKISKQPPNRKFNHQTCSTVSVTMSKNTVFQNCVTDITSESATKLANNIGNPIVTGKPLDLVQLQAILGEHKIKSSMNRSNILLRSRHMNFEDDHRSGRRVREEVDNDTYSIPAVVTDYYGQVKDLSLKRLDVPIGKGVSEESNVVILHKTQSQNMINRNLGSEKLEKGNLDSEKLEECNLGSEKLEECNLDSEKLKKSCIRSEKLHTGNTQYLRDYSRDKSQTNTKEKEDLGMKHLVSKPDCVARLIKAVVNTEDEGIISAVVDVVRKQSQGGKLSICGVKREPTVVDGVLVKTSQDILHRIGRFKDKPSRALLVNADLTPSYSHKGYKPFQHTQFTTTDNLVQGHTKSSIWLHTLLHTLKMLCVDIVLVKGVVSDAALSMCDSEGIIVINSVPYKVLEQVSEATEADLVTYVSLATEENVCKDVYVSPWLPDWCDRMCLNAHAQQEVLLYIGETTKVQTVILSEFIAAIVDLKEQELWDCLHQVTSVLQSCDLVKGEAEEMCADFLQDQTEKLLKTSAISSSPGLQNQHLVSETLQTCFKDYVTMATQTCDGKRNNVFECVKVKIAAWTRALDTAIIIMNTDCLIRTGLTETEDVETF